MDEKEVLLAMKRLRKIEEEARRRLIKEKEEKEKAKSKSEASKSKNEAVKEKTKPKTEAKVPAKTEAKVPAKTEAKVPAKTEAKPEPKVGSKKTSIPAAIKTLVWNKWIGEKVAEAGCYACKVTTITMRHHHTGHVISEKHGGGCTIDNLRPVCSNCNLSMGTMDMNEYIKKFGLHK